MMIDLLKMSRYLWRYRRLAKPGFHGFKYWDETKGSFNQFIKDRKFHVIEDRLLLLVSNLVLFANKDRSNEVPLFLVIKLAYHLLSHPMRYIDGSYKPVKEGYQELWKRVAKNFDVRLNSRIQAITRKNNGVQIQTQDQAFEFDKLIISCPFDKIENSIDVSESEKKNFTEIVYYAGYRGAFVAKNGPVNGIFWYPESYLAGPEPPYLVLAVPEAKIDEETYLYSCVFSYCPDDKNKIKTLQQSAEDFFQKNHNAQITEWVRMQFWPGYNCIFKAEAIDNYVYDNIHSMQGDKNTFYTGQLISLGSHSFVSEFSYDLIDHHF